MGHNLQFSYRQPKIIGEEQFRKYAVLVPFIHTLDGVYVLFEKRSNQLKKHPGEICFPGGKIEEGESEKTCAIRETVEELLIKEEQIEIIGPGDIFLSPFNIVVHPYMGVIKEYKDTYSLEEVGEIIKVPFEFFLNHQPEEFKSKLISQPPDDFPYEWIPGGVHYPWAKGNYHVFFYRYESLIIWGMTAHIMKSIVELIKEYNLIDYLKDKKK